VGRGVCLKVVDSFVDLVEQSFHGFRIFRVSDFF
jgi:hypothetical protein